MRTHITIVLALCLSTPHLLGAQVRSPEAQLKAAQHTEQVEGDLKGAIEAYKSLASAAGSNRPIAAQALMGMARCYQKLGHAEARAIYERIARDFADQPAVVAEARVHLTALAPPRVGQGLSARQVLRLPPSVDNFVLSPDGRLGGTDWDTGNLVMIDPATGSTTQLVSARFLYTPSTWGESPVASPDLRQFAYLWFDEAQPQFGPALRVMPMQPGSKHRTLVSDPSRALNINPIAWSKDGAAILVQLEKPVPAGDERPRGRGDFQVAWVSVADGTLTPLKTFEWWRSNVMFGNSLGLVSLSPDGQWIAYAVADRQGALDQSIWIMRADGTAERRLVRGGVNEQPVWTPDGSRLVFVSNRSGSLALWTVPVAAGGEPTPTFLKQGLGRVSLNGVTSNGSLVYTEEGGVDQLSMALLDTKTADGARPSLRTVDTLTGILPAWSPDGRYLAYKRRNPQAVGGGVELVVRSADSGEERTYLPKTGTMTLGRPVWHADGTVQAVGLSRIRVKVDGPRLEEVTGPAELRLGHVSPDGRTLYQDARNGHIASFDVASGAPRAQIPLPTGWRAVALSRDGRAFALMTIPDGSGAGGSLGRMDVDGGGFAKLPTPITRDVWNKAVWTRDGSAIVVGVSSGKDIWSIQRIPVAGGQPAVLAADIPRLRAFDISPDGTRIAFSTDNRTTEVWMLDLSSVLK